MTNLTFHLALYGSYMGLSNFHCTASLRYSYTTVRVITGLYHAKETDFF